MTWWSRLRGMVTRIAGGLLQPRGVLFASAGVVASYSMDSSMSTLARFPWVWTCVQAIASDLAGLPLVAVRTVPSAESYPASSGVLDGERAWFQGNREQRRAAIVRHRRAQHLRLVGAIHRRSGLDRTIVHDHALDTLYQPNAGSDGWLFRKQLAVDFVVTGNAFIWCPDGIGKSEAIYRLHPRSVRPIPGFLNVAAGYDWEDSATGEHRTLPVDQVLHLRDVNWEDSVQAILGESVVRCLHDDLTADLHVRETVGKASARGRPDLLFSAKGQVGPNLAKELKARWEEATQKGDGSFFIGDDVTATVLSWTPQEFADGPRAEGLRDMTLAVFNVPPTRAGLTTASYGGARQESRMYWEAIRSRWAPAFEGAYSRLAGDNVRIEHDYSSVEALQVSYTERLMRVSTWIGFGADPLEAAAYEGFDEAPLQPGMSSADAKPAKPIDRQPTEPQTVGGKIASALELHLRAAEAAYADLDSEGLERSLFARWQEEQLFAAFTAAGLVTKGDSPHAGARWWAHEIAGLVDELHRQGAEGAFSREFAERQAGRIAEWLRTQPTEEAA